MLKPQEELVTGYRDSFAMGVGITLTFIADAVSSILPTPCTMGHSDISILDDSHFHHSYMHIVKLVIEGLVK